MNKFYYILNIVATLFFVVASTDSQKSNDNEYLCFVDNTKPTYHFPNINKRQAKNDGVENLINEIHKLIVDNVDTYKNPEKLKEIANDKDKEKLFKRQENNKNVDNIINEIHNIIVDNIDTYKNPKILKEIVNNNGGNTANQDKIEGVEDTINDIHRLIMDNLDTYKNTETPKEMLSDNNKEEKRRLFKRQEKPKESVETIINNINNLIMDNLDTYENPEKLEELLSNNDDNNNNNDDNNNKNNKNKNKIERRKLFKLQEDKEEKEDEKKEKEEKGEENKNDVVNDVIKQIHNLIINNKDTYKNPEKLEELLHNKKELRRRNVDSALDKPEDVETIINNINNLIMDNLDTYENPEKLEELLSNNDDNNNINNKNKNKIERRKLFKRQEDKEEKEDEKKDKEEKEKENKNDDIVDDVIKQIHNLIINNKDTYKNPEKLEELLHNKKELRRRNVDSALDKPEGVETIINDTYENPEKLEEMLSNNDDNNDKKNKNKNKIERRKLFKRQEDKEEKEDEKKDKEEKEKENKNDDIVDDVIKQIHNLISNNKDTYKNPEKLEELLHNKKELRRRNVDSTLDKSNYANVISSSKNHTVITVFLSPILLKEVEALPNILSCIPNRKLKYSSYHYNKKDILQESKWKKVTVRENADRHLSLISQGKYNEKLIDQYDTNYYYPSSSGKDIDIILIDSGFNFEHPEFANKNERTIKCVKQIVNGEAVNPKSNEYCGTLEEDAKYHGESVADVAAGLIHGIANKANVNAIAVEKMDLKNLLGAIDYAKNHLIKPHQTVINIPVMDYFPVDDASTEYIDSLMDEITEKGGIIVNGSGNDGVNMNINNKTNDTIVLPCTSKNVICVGGIDNAGDDRKAKVMNSINYKKAQWSNFGKDINFYAPGSVHVEYYDKNNQTVDTIQEGTSFSASIVTGIIASIMSEHSEIEFTSEKMMDYLTKIGSKNIISEIPEDQPNIFINNGKHVVYSKNNKYNGCGIQAGNKKCGHDKCCSSDGQCRHDIESCKTSNGCQIKYGDCKIVKSSTEGRCGHGFGSCPSGKCCSHNGYCGKSSEHCGLGCQLNYGHCN